LVVTNSQTPAVRIFDVDPPPARDPVLLRLLAGAPPEEGAESLRRHRFRLGAEWSPEHGEPFIEALRDSGLTGRGGSAFPAWRKWTAVAQHARNTGAVVVANGSEGEPASRKDRHLMRLRPHLIIDGLLIAAEKLGARLGVIYLPRDFAVERATVLAALRERDDVNRRGRPQIRMVSGPHRYVAGESSAVVSFLNGGEARPQFARVRTSEQGVDGLPTLVQNVETLAHVALIGRRGPTWFRRAGTTGDPGTALVTVGGSGRLPAVIEIERGAPLALVAQAAGVDRHQVGPVLVGGYFGTWLNPADAWATRLDAEGLASVGAAFGCGSISLLPAGACALVETAAVLAFLARESARQCGPCWNGLDAIAATFGRIAAGAGRDDDLARLTRWADAVADRGACHHPDGALMLLRSCLRANAEHVEQHLARGASCSQRPLLPTPTLTGSWL
jgi:NADH:ubiquinone oxidoreductase subunit F (NADH-binding)